MALYYADLSNAWYNERVPGLNDALAAQGWQRLSWCEDADWEAGSWMDKGHPERPTASVFLTRLLFQLPPPRAASSLLATARCPSTSERSGIPPAFGTTGRTESAFT